MAGPRGEGSGSNARITSTCRRRARCQALSPITAAAAVRKAAMSTCGTAIRLLELNNTSDRLISSARPRAGLISKQPGAASTSWWQR